MNNTPKHVTLYTEASPNPQSLKFVANFLLVPEGITFDFPTKESAEESPLAKAFFENPFIKRIFVMNNFITLTKNEEVDWYEIAPELKAFLKEYLEANKPLFASALLHENTPNEHEPEVNLRIRKILDEYIRPAVEQDGGAINFRSFEDGKVTVALQGSCSGCPSASITLKMGIENLLKRMIPEVQNVVAEEV
jgi:NFU1 iron-sulfur cluster scaffold homolog, mitochondrial